MGQMSKTELVAPGYHLLGGWKGALKYCVQSEY